MDERFRGKNLWIGLGALALIFLCVMICALGAMALGPMRFGSAYGVAPYVQAPTGGEGATPVPAYHYGYGPLGILTVGIGLAFKLLFSGLLLVLLTGLIRRLFWRPWSWCPSHGGKPPEDQEGVVAGV